MVTSRFSISFLDSWIPWILGFGLLDTYLNLLLTGIMSQYTINNRSACKFVGTSITPDCVHDNILFRLD